jgi:colanic acid biosynthesis glycosyl transferase WcaI
MHILFLTHYFPPEVNAPASRTFEHCSRWVQQGHQVTIVTCAPNCPTGVVFDGYRNAWRTVEHPAGMRVIRVWTYLSANKGFAGRILNFVSYMLTAVWQAIWLRNVDVVIATSPQFFCGWAGVLCHWIRRWPFVLEIRDIWPESIVAVGAMQPSLAIRVLEWLERRMYRAADHIVTVGDGYRQQLLERQVPSDKISVIPNGVDLQKFQPRPADAALRAKWGGGDRFVCAYIGTIGMAHGLEVVLQAAAQLQHAGQHRWQFWIVGDGAERETLEQQAKGQGLQNVVFTGMVPKDQIDAVLASCDACLVHLRGTELFGTVIPSKVFETMAMNIPIIMGVKGQAQQIVLDGQGGVPMIPDDADDLCRCLHTIAAQPGRFTKGRSYVAQHYSRSDLAERLLSVVQSIAEGRTPQPVRSLDSPAARPAEAVSSTAKAA